MHEMNRSVTGGVGSFKCGQGGWLNQALSLNAWNFGILGAGLFSFVFRCALNRDRCLGH